MEEMTIEVPPDLVEALGGLPVPPPLLVKTGPPDLAASPADPVAPAADMDGSTMDGWGKGGGLLAAPDPSRAVVRAQIESARLALRELVEHMGTDLETVGRRLDRLKGEEAFCQIEGFPLQAARNLVRELKGTLDRFLT